MHGVIEMQKQISGPTGKLDLRLDPEKRLCPQFDHVGIAMYSVAAAGEMGVRVLDNCCEDHIM